MPVLRRPVELAPKRKKFDELLELFPPLTIGQPLSPPRDRQCICSNQSLLVIIVVGIVAGWLAGQMMRGGGFGLIGDLIVGLDRCLSSATGSCRNWGIDLGVGIVALIRERLHRGGRIALIAPSGRRGRLGISSTMGSALVTAGISRSRHSRLRARSNSSAGPARRACQQHVHVIPASPPKATFIGGHPCDSEQSERRPVAANAPGTFH